MEYLLGRALENNVTNLLLAPLAKQVLKEKKLNLLDILEQEPDAGLGNGGLGRLAACFIESAATMQLPVMGYGLLYEYGIFKQSIHNGWQHETPDNWLRSPDPWQFSRPNEKVEVSISCSFELRGGSLRPVPGRASTFTAIPFDRPVIGYGGTTINTLRLWAAAPPDKFNFEEFSHGDFVEAFTQTLSAETLTSVLYPDDSTFMGQGLRFVQEYFLVACSLADAVRRFQRSNSDWHLFPEKVAIQMNDTHPALAVPELMRILVDQKHLGWDEAWLITQVHIILNAYWEALDFELPILRDGTQNWRRWIDTALDPPHEICEWGAEKPVLGTTYRAGSRSVVVLIAGEAVNRGHFR